MDSDSSSYGQRKRRAGGKRERTPRAALNAEKLEELAVSYVARFATSRAKLRTYLQRKLRERGWDGEREPDLEALTTRFADKGYIDDAAYAKSRAGSLVRRGYGPRRVAQTLHHDGIEETDRNSAAPGEVAYRSAAIALARKRGFGPFGDDRTDPALREKRIAAMLRAGHDFNTARFVLDAADEDALNAWVDEAREGY